MARIEGTYDETAEPSQGFDQIPAGRYEAQIVESSIEDISQNSNKGRCISLTWKILNGDFKDRQVWQRINVYAENMTNLDKVISIAMSQLAAVRKATGRGVVKDTEELHFIGCEITVGPQKNNPQYNEIKAVAPIQQNYSPRGDSAPASTPAANASGGNKPWKRPAA